MMKYRYYNLEIREGSGKTDTPTYICGILWILSIMFRDLQEQLSDECRNFGIVKSYINSINHAYSRMNLDDEKTYRRVLYIFKPSLLKEHKRLTLRHLSPADSNICIMRKLAMILSEEIDFEYNKEIGTILKILTKLYDNIRNKSKKDSLFSLASSIRRYLKSGILGKHEISQFTLLGNEDDQVKELKIKEEKIVIEQNSNSKIMEINMTNYGKKDD